MQPLDLIVELDWTEMFFRMLDLIVELIETPVDWIGKKIWTWFWILPSYAAKLVHSQHTGEERWTKYEIRNLKDEV